MSKKKILVVDDEEDIRYVLRRFLEESDYEVLEAKGGPQCLELIEKEKPDLVILDIIMPGMSGWEVCRHIKQNEAYEGIPVSMLSVLSDPSDVNKSLTYSNADTHLSKPIDFIRLSNTVKDLLKKPKKPGKKPKAKKPPEDDSEFFKKFGHGVQPLN